MAGKADMDLFGWKQLALWSIEHACLDGPERDAALRQWEREWDAFLRWVVAEHGSCVAAEGEEGGGGGEGEASPRPEQRRGDAVEEGVAVKEDEVKASG